MYSSRVKNELAFIKKIFSIFTLIIIITSAGISCKTGTDAAKNSPKEPDIEYFFSDNFVKKSDFEIDNILKSQTPVLTVAANDSPAASKTQADYVCNGENSVSEIMKAIDSLPPDGGDIRLASGTYEVDVNLLVLSKPNIHIYGETNSIIKLADNQPAGGIIQIAADGCAFKGITVDGNFQKQGLEWPRYNGICVSTNITDTIITNCTIINVGNDAVITYSGNHRTKVYKNIIRDCGEGILFQGSDSCEAIGNRLYNIGTGSGTTQDGIEPSGSSYCWIQDNLISNVSGSGIDIFRNSHHATAIGNTVIDYSQQAIVAGISVQGHTGTCDYARIIGNTIGNGLAQGICFYEARYGIIENNDISGTSGNNGHGIRCMNFSSQNLISSNKIHDVCIGIQAFSGNTTITGNSVINTNRGIDAQGGNCVVTGNKVENVVSGESAIKVTDNNNTITDNYIDLKNNRNAYGIQSLGDYDYLADNTIVNLPTAQKRLVVKGKNSTVE